MSLILTACEFKTNVVLPEKDKNEIEINVIKEKIEMAEKEIKLLMEINQSIDDTKFKSKIMSKDAVNDVLFKHRHLFDDQSWLIEYSQNCNRIYKLMERIQVWNEKIKSIILVNCDNNFDNLWLT